MTTLTDKLNALRSADKLEYGDYSELFDLAAELEANAERVSALPKKWRALQPRFEQDNPTAYGIRSAFEQLTTDLEKALAEPTMTTEVYERVRCGFCGTGWNRSAGEPVPVSCAACEGCNALADELQWYRAREKYVRDAIAFAESNPDGVIAMRALDAWERENPKP